MSRARIFGVAALAACALGLAASSAQASTRHGDAPSGPRAFIDQIHWSTSTPARGVQLLSGSFSDPAVHPSWTVTIQAPAHSPFDGSLEVAEAGSSAWAQQTETALTADGFAPPAPTIHWPRYTDDPRGVLGVRVRVGEFADRADATTEATTLTADGFAPLVEWEGFDPQQPPAAELLHAAIVDPRTFAGRVEAIHGTAVAS